MKTRVIEVEHDSDGLRLRDKATGQYPLAGAVFYAPWIAERQASELAPKYFALPEPRRAPIAVMCPNGDFFCVDTLAYEAGRGHHGSGWDVSGSIDALTIVPSINIVGRWHGFLREGVFTTA